MTTTLELIIEDRVVRKLRALSALEGFSSPSQMISKASDIFECAIDDAIRAHINEPAKGYSDRLVDSYPEQGSRQAKGAKAEEGMGYGGLSDSLGDDVDYDAAEPEAETDAFAMVPKSGGLSDKEIEHDMEVDDPEHEAAAESPIRPGPNDNAEDLFLALSGIPLSMDEDTEIDHRILKRNKRVKLKAKVTGLLEDAQVSEIF